MNYSKNLTILDKTQNLPCNIIYFNYDLNFKIALRNYAFGFKVSFPNAIPKIINTLLNKASSFLNTIIVRVFYYIF